MEPKEQLTMSPRLIPTGDCWCGCGKEVGLGSFFAPGHDKIAESGVILSEYGSVPNFLLAHKFGPGGRSACDALDAAKTGPSAPVR
jgi:hypothetical protein